MKASEVTHLVGLLQGAYPSHPLLRGTVMVYESMLADLEFAPVLNAIVSHIATNKYFPTVAEIRGRVIEERLHLPSFEEAVAMIRRKEKLPKAVVKALESVGGTWEAHNTTNPATWRAQFRRSYEACRREVLDEYNTQSVLKELNTAGRASRLIGGA